MAVGHDLEAQFGGKPHRSAMILMRSVRQLQRARQIGIKRLSKYLDRLMAAVGTVRERGCGSTRSTLDSADLPSVPAVDYLTAL